MSRNKLPQEDRKVRFMTIYINPKARKFMDKLEISKYINKLQTEALTKCANESLKSKRDENNL